MKKTALIPLTLTLLALLSACTYNKQKQNTDATESLSEIAADAFIYGRPLLESYDNIYRFAIDATNKQYAALNTYYTILKPSTPKDTWVVTPNIDTPYMRAWMELTNDAVVLIVPKIDDERYWVLQLMDVYSNNLPYVGSRTEGWNGGKFLVTGPDWKGEVPEGFKQVKSTTNYCAILGRIFVKNEADIPTLNKIQDGFKIMSLNQYNGEEVAKSDSEWLKPVDVKSNPLEMYSIINQMILKNPPADDEKQDIEAFAALGFGEKFDLAKLTEEQIIALTEGLEIAKQRITKQLSPEGGEITFINGWLVPNETLGNFKRDYLNRACVTVQGYMANSPEEAVYYYAAVDAQNNPITGENNYTIHFDKGQTPDVQFFWSITMYKSSDKLLIENEINRYGIGNVTEGLKYNKDGSLDIYIQAEKPEGDKAANWLPAPKEPFYVILRMYGPSEAIIKKEYNLPGLVIAE